jgi:hypothetical protein
MREIRTSGSVEGVFSNEHPYSDSAWRQARRIRYEAPDSPEADERGHRPRSSWIDRL